jgi:SAM-dependent methyltransferase
MKNWFRTTFLNGIKKGILVVGSSTIVVLSLICLKELSLGTDAIQIRFSMLVVVRVSCLSYILISILQELISATECLKRILITYKWVKAAAEKIPFPDGQFDFVLCRALLHHLENPSVGLKEMYRVLKPGGTFSCWDPNAATLATTFRKMFQKTERFSHLHHSFKDEELFKMIEDAGFQITEKRYIGFLAYPLCGFPDIKDFKIPLWFGRNLISIDDLISKTPLKKLAWSLMIRAVKKERAGAHV